MHAFLKIRDRCKGLKTLFPQIKAYVWQVYHTHDAVDFRQQMTEFQAWAQRAVTGTALEAIEKLVAKTDRFVLAFDYPQAYRTSNMIDRLIEPMARWLFSARAFHGHWRSAELQVRAWALCHNFWPYCPRARATQHYLSPAHKLNGFVYHPNWLHNLLISTSSTGMKVNHRKC